MKWILIPLLLVFMGLAVVSLVRGIAAFLNSTREDLERGDTVGATKSQQLQNRMMINRIKFQALAVVVVLILLGVSSRGGH